MSYSSSSKDHPILVQARSWPYLQFEQRLPLSPVPPVFRVFALLVRRASCVVRRASCVVRRASCIVRRASCACAISASHDAQHSPQFVDTQSMFDYERLDVYQCSLQYTALALKIIDDLPRGQSALADQMRRATMSIPLNIAEAAGKTTHKDRCRFHAIARGSAMECGAIIDIIRLLGIYDDRSARARDLLIRIVSMLTKMTR